MEKEVIIITARKLSLGQGNIFTSVGLSTWGSRSLSWGFSVRWGGFYPGGILPGVSVPGGSLSRGVSFQGVYVQEGLCRGGKGSVQGDLCLRGSLFRMSLSRSSLSGDIPWTKTPRQVWIQDLPRRGRGQLRRLKVADIMKRSRIFAKRKARVQGYVMFTPSACASE